MKKVRSNARWNELSAEQIATLAKWLFEEKLSYTVAWERAQKEFGFQGSRASVHRFYQRREKERVRVDFEMLRDQVMAVSDAPGDALSAWDASMKVLGQFLFERVRNAPDKVKEWAPVADLMVRNNYNQLIREAKAREHKIREDAMAFAKEKFEFDMTEQALKALPRLQELAEAKKDPELKRYEENARRNRLRRAMFGVGHEVQPESPEEEAEMLAAKREREARHEAERAASAEQKRISEELDGAQPPTPSSQYYEQYMAEKTKREAETQAREKVYQESQKQAAVVSEAEEAEQEKLEEQQETERAEQKKLREERKAAAQARFEEMRELCGWQELQKPPGWEEET